MLPNSHPKRHHAAAYLDTSSLFIASLPSIWSRGLLFGSECVHRRLSPDQCRNTLFHSEQVVIWLCYLLLELCFDKSMHCYDKGEVATFWHASVFVYALTNTKQALILEGLQWLTRKISLLTFVMVRLVNAIHCYCCHYCYSNRAQNHIW